MAAGGTGNARSGYVGLWRGETSLPCIERLYAGFFLSGKIFFFCPEDFDFLVTNDSNEKLIKLIVWEKCDYSDKECKNQNASHNRNY